MSRRREGADEATFLLGVLAVLAFSPIVWHHYLVARCSCRSAIYSPRLTRIWCLPLACWIGWKGRVYDTGWFERTVFWMRARGRSSPGCSRASAPAMPQRSQRPAARGRQASSPCRTPASTTQRSSSAIVQPRIGRSKCPAV